jgi:hypothetical protein
VTDTPPPTPSLARFRGPVACRRTVDALILSGPAGDCAAEVLILTFIGPRGPDLPGSLAGAGVLPLGERRYRITCGSRDWVIEATAVHLHRDVGNAFYRALPPRPAPLAKRLFWRVVLALAGTRPGKRLLLALRRK